MIVYIQNKEEEKNLAAEKEEFLFPRFDFLNLMKMLSAAVGFSARTNKNKAHSTGSQHPTSISTATPEKIGGAKKMLIYYTYAALHCIGMEYRYWIYAIYVCSFSFRPCVRCINKKLPCLVSQPVLRIYNMQQMF
jgi:hypothetical protein